MDHHGDWDQWHEDEHSLDGDTADLGGGHDDYAGHDEYQGHEEHGGYDSYEDADAQAPDLSHGDLSQGPDLVHEGGSDDLDHDDFSQHDLAGADAGADHDNPPDHLVGVDPDLPPGPDGAWHDGDFPPPLDLDVRPEPSDGYPWADPDTLGDPAHGYGLQDDPGPAGSAPAGDLFAYAGLDAPPPGVDPWGHLLASDDPATGALARFWGPSGG